MNNRVKAFLGFQRDYLMARHTVINIKKHLPNIIQLQFKKDFELIKDSIDYG